MELIQGSETSANYNLTPGKYPKEHIQYSNHGESLKLWILYSLEQIKWQNFYEYGNKHIYFRQPENA